MNRFIYRAARISRVPLLLGALFLVTQAFAADTYKIVYPFAAGGAADLLTRMMAQNMSVSMDANFIVENVGGANGNIGVSKVAKAVPDGKTLLVTSETYTTVNPLLFTSGMNFKPDELDPLILIVVQPMVLVVRPESGIKTFEDFLRRARAEGMSYSSAGVGATGHITMAYFADEVPGLKLLHVPFSGGPQAINAILGGHVDTGFLVAGNVLPQVRGGKLVALAVSGEKRLPQLPNVRTVAEMGYPKFVADNGVLLLVPARTPEDVKQRLTAEARKAVDTPEVHKFIDDNGYVLRAASREETKLWLAQSTAKWFDLVTKRNILKE